jgi:hypothetical protein
MWMTTYHRFPNRAAFLAACAEAGWECPPGQDPILPHGVATDIVGPLIGPASIGEGGVPIAGEVIDHRYHVNLAWHGREPDPAFEASLVVPEAPSRGWDITTPPASRPPTPPTIPAWNGKAVLCEHGLLHAVEAAVQVAGGRVEDAWSDASEWDRSSEFLHALAAVLGLDDPQVDQMFRDAAAIQS